MVQRLRALGVFWLAISLAFAFVGFPAPSFADQAAVAVPKQSLGLSATDAAKESSLESPSTSAKADDAGESAERDASASSNLPDAPPAPSASDQLNDVSAPEGAVAATPSLSANSVTDGEAPEEPVAPEATVTLEGSTLYANGVDILVKRDSDSKIYIFNSLGTQKLIENAFTSAPTIYGGL